MPGTSSTDRFRRVFELLDQGVVVFEDGRIIQVNPAWAKLIGMDEDEAEGQDILEFIAPDARDEILERLDKGETGPYPSLLKPAHGENIPVRVRHHEFAEEGHHLHVVVVRDMRPELERIERRTTGTPEGEELERLRATDRFKTQLLNTAAHELNTPITPLRLQTHLLKSGSLGTLSDKQQRAVSILDRNVQRISLLVKDILDVARMEAGNLKVEAKPTDVDSLLNDVFDSFHDAAEQVRIRLHRSGAHGLAVEADPDRIVQVLYNLISNALKFTPADGIVRAHVAEDDGMVKISVQDTGIGLTDDQIAMLFKPFSQAHDPKDFSATGTGLGLYISRGIVEAHGGTIECSSDGPGKGSTFTVALPRSEADPSEWVAATGSAPAKAEVKREDAMLERLRELI